jgi:knotted carbamoyltransferase YgeW
MKYVLGEELIRKVASLNFGDLYLKDFLNTWDKTQDQLKSILLIAKIIKVLRENNFSPKVFDSGLAISIFRDQSTRTRFSFVSASNLLGLLPVDFDEKKSQVAHGETLRETANMISFMAEVIGIRDDMFIGIGEKYMNEISKAVKEGFENGILNQLPVVINLQSDVDHPTQSLSDLLHLMEYFGGLENLKGKKIAVTWAYSPSYGKPLSVPQALIGLMTRFGMDVTLAHPKGYDLLTDVITKAEENVKSYGGSFTKTHNMEEAFLDADIVYPKSWAPFEAMKKRSELFLKGDMKGVEILEKELLDENAQHKDWTCSEELMKKTKNGKALYMHCLPADINGVSSKEGEVDATVFERYRINLYKEASFKPYIIAAMILLAKVKNPLDVLAKILSNNSERLKC